MVLNESKYIYNTLKPWSNYLDNITMGLEFEMAYNMKQTVQNTQKLYEISRDISKELFINRLPIYVIGFIDAVIKSNEVDSNYRLQFLNNCLELFVNNNPMNQILPISPNKSYIITNSWVKHSFSEGIRLGSMKFPIPSNQHNINFLVKINKIDRTKFKKQVSTSDKITVNILKDIIKLLTLNQSQTQELERSLNNNKLDNFMTLYDIMNTDINGNIIMSIQTIQTKAQIENWNTLSNQEQQSIQYFNQLLISNNDPIVIPYSDEDKKILYEQLNPKKIFSILKQLTPIQLEIKLSNIALDMDLPSFDPDEFQNIITINKSFEKIKDELINIFSKIKDSSNEPFTKYEFLVNPPKSLNDPTKFKILTDSSIGSYLWEDYEYIPLEVVTPALPYKDQMIFQENFIKFMRKNSHKIEVNDTTGLHVNISYNNISTDELDYSVIQLFLDEEYYKQNFRLLDTDEEAYFQENVLNKLDFISILFSQDQITEINYMPPKLEIDYKKFNLILEQFNKEVYREILNKNRTFHYKHYQIEFRILGNKYTEWESTWKKEIQQVIKKIEQIGKDEYKFIIENQYKNQEKGIRDSLNYFQFLIIQQYMGIDQLPTKLKMMQIKKIYNLQYKQLSQK